MRVVCQKLSSRRGETLLETLFTLLIVSLACVVFATMTMISSSINETAKIADTKLYAELSAAETHSDPIVKTATVTWHRQAQNYSQNFSVNVTGTAHELMSYSLIRGGG
jgi:hypothetical protein